MMVDLKEMKLAIREAFEGEDKLRLAFMADGVLHAWTNLFVEKQQKRFGEKWGYALGHVQAGLIGGVLLVLPLGGVIFLLIALRGGKSNG